ncbi:NADH-quinone oxidoreductase subunit C [Escherichia coli]
MFRLTPYVMVGVMLTIATALPVVTVGSPLPQLGDLITLLYLFAIARFFFAISGLDTGSPFTAIGASREAMLACWLNRCCCLAVGRRTGCRFHQHQQHHRHRLSLATEPEHPAGAGACAGAFATFIEMGKLPFDLAGAEQELQEGPLSEYSGSGFGVMKWGISLKQLVVLQMFVGVSIPWEQREAFTVGGLLLALVIAIVQSWWSAYWLSRCSKTAWPVCVLILLRALPGLGLALHFSVRLLAGGVIKESLSMSEEKLGQHYLAALNEAFPGVVLDHGLADQRSANRHREVNYLPEVVEFLYYKQGGWLFVLFGNDERKLNGHYAVYYVLSMEKGTKCWVTVRVEVDANKPEYPSAMPRVPAAVWGEREVRDMYGLIPVGLPDERRLVLPDDWPYENFILCVKTAWIYRAGPVSTTDAETYEFINELGDKKNNVVPIGPLHVTSDEPGHFRLFVDGENIIDADYRLFYVHRGMEKLAETRMGYNEVTFLSDRVCGIRGFAHSTAYTTSVENAMGIQVPERAQMIRAILLEVERLHSHLLNLGLACHFTGFDSGFMQFFRVRETSMKMAEILTGARKTYGLNLIGGIRRDLLKDGMIQTRQLAQQMRREVQELVDVLLSTPTWNNAPSALVVWTRKIARDFSNVGPMVRASGHARDTRAYYPLVMACCQWKSTASRAATLFPV